MAAEQTVEVLGPNVCPTCNGSGQVPVTGKIIRTCCPTCRGTGQVLHLRGQNVLTSLQAALLCR
jgi:DnaJ-class molecular chaperone